MAHVYDRLQHGGPICPAAEMVGPRQFGDQRGWPRDPVKYGGDCKTIADAFENLMKDHRLHQIYELKRIKDFRMITFLDALMACMERGQREGK